MSTLSKVQEWLAGVLGDNGDYRPPKITPRTALTIAAVWYAASKIAGDIGQMPLCPYKTNGETIEKDRRNRAFFLVMKEANRYQTANFFKELLTLHALLWGNGRAYIVRDQNGVATELLPIAPDRCETYLINGEKVHIYEADKDEPAHEFSTERHWVIEDKDVLHVPGLSMDGIAGISVVAMAKNSLSINSAADARSAKQMNKGFTGRVMLQAPVGAFRKADDAREFVEQFREAHDASKDGEMVGMLREGVTANVLTLPNNDMQFLETRAFQNKEVMLWFGLESLPGDKDSVSYNSLEQKRLGYHQGTLSRWCDRWEQACNKHLLSETDKRQGTRYFKFSTAALLRGTTKERYEVYQIGRQIGVLSANDVRKLEDMNPVEGGDKYDNPAITPGADEQPSTVDEPAQTTNQSANASAVLLQNLIKVETNKAKEVAKKGRNFLSWMDKFYPKWESTLADTIEAIGGDRQLATDYCNESRRMLLECTDKATQDQLLDVVTTCVESWKFRAFAILENMELQNV